MRPQLRLPRARGGSCSSCSWPGHDGHRGLGEQGFVVGTGAGAGAHPGDLLPSVRPRSAAARARAVRRNIRAWPLAAIEDSKQRPFARAPFALGIRGGREATARNLAERSRHRRPAGSHRGSSSPCTWNRREDGRLIHAQLHDPDMEEVIEDLRRIGLRFAEEGLLSVRGPSRRQGSGAHRHPPQLDPRGGHRADPGRGRARDGVRVEKHRLPRRGRGRGVELAKAQRLEVTVLDEAGLRALLDQ